MARMTANRRFIVPRFLRRAICKRIALLLGVVLAANATSLPIPAHAQDATLSSTYITPFPENDTYRVQVYGDSLAEGLMAGLNEAFAGDTRLQLQRGRHPVAGIFRNEFDDELRTIETNLSRVPVHVAVVMVGLYDRYAWRPQGMRRINTGSDEWKAEYGRRVDRLMKLLKTKGVALYWVGLPIMRRPEASDDAQMVNEIVRERALVNGQKFIDTFTQFSSETGTFSAYGPELDGKIRLLREADGAHFTPAGYRKLAHFVEREIRRDLSQARSERNIPLAGAEAEQKRIRPSPPPVASAPAAGAKGAPTPGKDVKIQSATVDKPGATARAAAPSSADGSGPGDVKADNSRITLKGIGAGGKEESIAVEIVRPAIPASVLAVVTRRESPDRASQVGDSITSEIAGALTVISSVTLTTDGPTDRRRMPPTQTPYYRALVKGERLAPRPGRADDFSWPKPEPPPVDAAAEAQSSSPSGVTLVPAKARRPASPSG